MSSNYPPGVTGSEYAIAGPDYEKVRREHCPECQASGLFEQGYAYERWLVCGACEFVSPATRNGSDPFAPYRKPRKRKGSG